MLAAAVLAAALSGCGCEHEVVIDEGYPATCTEDGLTDGEHCAICGKVLKEQEVIECPGHDWEYLYPVGPTCTEPGLTWGEVCSVCGEVQTPQEPDEEPLGHDFEDGVCTRCGERLPVWESLPMTNEFGDETGEFFMLNQVGFDTDHETYNKAYIAVYGTDEAQIMLVRRDISSGLRKYFFSSTFKVLIRQGGGEATELTGWGYGDYISFPFEEDRALLVEYLSGGETVDIYLEGRDSSSEHCLFSVEPDNFAELYAGTYAQAE